MELFRRQARGSRQRIREADEQAEPCHDLSADHSYPMNSHSDAGGKTWEVSGITNQTRVTDESDKAH